MPGRFRQDEIEKLLDLTEEQLPMGAESWQIVAADYNHWCIDKGYAQRDWESIRDKYKKLRNTRKPTGIFILNAFILNHT